MFNKNSNKTLWIIFAILLVAVVIIFSTESTKKERSFRKDLVSIDTNSISSFSIFPKSKNGAEVKFLKTDNVWKVIGADAKSFTVPNFKVKNLFNELVKIKPKRVAARSKAKWTEYQVDSTATRVVVNEDGSKVLDLIIGKFAFQQPRSMSTFVRLNDETDIYEVDGFLDMTFNKDINSFRNETVVKSDKNLWNKLSFSSNNSEPFDLVRVADHWTIDGARTDSAKTVTALNALAGLSNTNYVDNVTDGLLPQETSKLVIEVAEGESIEITAFQNDAMYVVHSSQNMENYFDGTKIGDKIFITKESLF